MNIGIIDSMNLIEFKDKKNEIYPFLVIFKNSKLISLKYQSPNNDILKELN